MTDLALFLPAGTSADIVFNGDLQTDDGLATAIIISVWTDARAGNDDLARFGMAGQDPRGWWADSVVPVVPNDNTGSFLWLLSRAKQTEETRLIAQDMIRAALKWVIDDGIAKSVDVFTQWTKPGVLGWRASILKSDGTRFELEWQSSMKEDF